MADSLDSRDLLLNQLAEDFAARQRAGDRPRVEEYCERHPELADDIRSLFPAMIELEQAKAVAGPASNAPPVTHLGDFRLLREVGRGGMGVVYEAEQVSLGRRVAIKLLPASMFRDPTKRLRFEREAKSAARLHHSNIVPVHGIGEHGGTPYYVMQYIPGLGLDAVIEELRRLPGPGRVPEPTRAPTSGGYTALSVTLARSLHGNAVGSGWDGCDESPASSVGQAHGSSTSHSGSGVHLPGQTEVALDGSTLRKITYWESVARIGVQVARALAYAHKLGVLHRDIKPANLLLDLEAVVWVTDFGLAKAADDSDDLTRTGDFLGTLRYMPPEAFEGKSDARSDIYALGLTLFELVALRPAYDERDRNKLVKEVTIGDPPRLRNFRRDAPRDLITIIEKACDRDPARRYQTASELAGDLQLFLDGRPIVARRATDLERLWMWSRRRPALAGMIAALCLCLIAGSVVSTWFAIQADHFSREAATRENEAIAARDSAWRSASDAEKARDAELTQRQRAEKEKRRADLTLADVYSSRGLRAGERDAGAEAALWFAAAADQSAAAEDSQRESDNRLRAWNWMRQAIVPVAAEQLFADLEQLDFQPHGDLLLARSGKGLILWSWQEGKRLHWAEKLVEVASAQFSPDGTFLALGFLSGKIQLHNPTTGAVIESIPHQDRIEALAFSPDGKLLAVASQIVRVWDIKRRVFLSAGWNHPQPVTAVTFNRKGDRLITSCKDRHARVFAVDDGLAPARSEPLFAPVVHNVPRCPILIDDDRELVCVANDSELTRWDLATGKSASPPIRTKATLLRGVTGSADGKWFAAGGNNGPDLFAVNPQHPPMLQSHTNSVRSLSFSPNSEKLLSVSWDQTARLWTLPQGTPLGAPLKHMANVESCAWSQDNRHIATVQNDGLTRVWRLPAGDPVIAREPGWGILMRPRISFDGRLVVPGTWHESPMDVKSTLQRLRILATADGRPAGADIPLPGSLVDSCICTDNRGVAAIVEAGEKGLLAVWDVSSGRARFDSIPLPGLPLAVAARPGNNQLAVICQSGDIVVINDRTGKRHVEARHEPWLPMPGRAVDVQYSPDGKTLVTLCSREPTSINLLDAETGKLRSVLRPTVKGSNFHAFTISADSKWLASLALVNNHVQVWDLEAGRAVSEPLPHPGDFWGLFSVRFSPDGRHLLTSHKDGQVRYWDWQAAKLACPPMVHDDDVMHAAVTPDGRFALTSVRGRPEIQIWELKTGRLIASPVRLAHRKSASTLPFAITPDGRRALVSYMPAELATLDLEERTRSPSVPTPELALFAELASAQRIELGDLSGLTTDQWLAGWKLLRDRNPGLVRSLHERRSP